MRGNSMPYYKASIPLSLDLGFRAESEEEASDFVETCLGEMLAVSEPWPENLSHDATGKLITVGVTSNDSETTIEQVDSEDDLYS
jgi:hypothetical protein